MIFWLDLFLFASVVLLALNWRKKNWVKFIGGLLIADLIGQYLIHGSGFLWHAYRSLLFYSPVLILYYLPLYGYEHNWLGAKKNVFTLAILIGLAFILVFIVSDTLVSKLYFSK